MARQRNVARTGKKAGPGERDGTSHGDKTLVVTCPGNNLLSVLINNGPDRCTPPGGGESSSSEEPWDVLESGEQK